MMKLHALTTTAVLATASVAAAQPYTYHLTVIDRIGNSSIVRLEDVNDDGTVVGWANYSGQPTRGFTWTEAGGFTFLPSPESPADDVRPKGISNSGLIAATCDRDYGASYPYARAHIYTSSSGFWSQIHPWTGCTSVMQAMSANGHFCGEVQHLNNGNCGDQFVTGEAFTGFNLSASTIGRLSQWPNWAHDVNNNGDTCGEGYLASGNEVRGYIRPAGGTITQLPGLGGSYAFAYGLNDDQVMVGQAYRPGDDFVAAVRWENTGAGWAIEELAPDSDGSTAWAINNGGQIVGWSWNASLMRREAKIWIGNQSWNLDDLIVNPQGYIDEPRAISDTGWIIGRIRIGNETKSFILKPIDRDSDGDGLLDSWEISGVPYTAQNGSTQYFTLPDADPEHKDLYVELDVRSGQSFSNTSIELLEQAFASAPLPNPDGSDGVNLHILKDESNLTIPQVWQTDGCWPNDFDAKRTSYFGTSAERSDPNHEALLDAKAKAYRYCIAAHSADNHIGGCGQTPGDNFVIFVGSPAYNDENKAAVFMHELGHNLGLRHGGGDSVNGKPNYPSVMNYVLSYKYNWNAAFWRMDFSRNGLDVFAPLNESSLDENAGIGSGGTLYDSFKMPFGVNVDDGMGGTTRSTAYVTLDGSAADFGDTAGNGTQDMSFDTGVSQDLNYAVANAPAGVPSSPSPSQTLDPFNDWANVGLPLAATLGTSAAPPQYPDDELTTDAKEWIDANFPPPPGGCIADWNSDSVFNTADFVAYLNDYNAVDGGGTFTFGDPDIADPVGVLNTADFVEFLNLYTDGCP